MFESKKGKVNVCVKTTNFLGDVAICLCFKLELNGCVMNRLKGAGHCDCLSKGCAEACAAYALYLAVADKLCGNPLAAKNSKVGRVDVGYHNGHLFFTWKMKGVVSHVRKALGVAVSALKPGSLYSLYSHCMRNVGGKANKEHFNNAANKIINGLNQGVDCCIVGKINMGKTASDSNTKVSDMAEKINKKLNPGSAGSPRSEYDDGKKCDHKTMTELNVSGWKAYVVRDYIMSKARGVEPLMCNKSLLVPMKSSSYEALKNRIKKQVDTFVNQKYSKLGEECGPVLAYLAIANSCLSCADSKQLCRVKSSEVINAIKSNI